jgi:hypothetical protein
LKSQGAPWPIPQKEEKIAKAKKEFEEMKEEDNKEY